MLRIINFRIPVQDAERLEELLIKKYSPLQGRIKAIHVVRQRNRILLLCTLCS